MQRFHVRLIKLGFLASGADLPGDLILTPRVWSANDRGGCRDAQIEASGGGESLAGLTGWLGDKVEIYNEAGDPVWWGVLWDMDISLGNILVSMSMDNVFNRVAVTYPFQMADGSEESRTTDWVEDANSIDQYGTRELLYGLPENLSRAPETVRDQLLERFKRPGTIISTQAAGEYAARLNCRGAWQKASSIYFTNADGMHEYTDGVDVQVIGRHIVSDVVSFGAFTVDADPEDLELAGGAGFTSVFVSGDTFTISGAAQAGNNDTWTISNVESDGHLEVTGEFIDEDEGADVQISHADHVSEDNIAITFQVPTAWTATHVAVQVRRIGNPTDNFRIGIYPDSAGAPGTVLGVNETDGGDIFTEMTWTEFELDTPVALSAATTYWLGMRRTGTANLADGYEVTVDEDLGNTGSVLRVLHGASWVARTVDADMPFRIIGEIDSTAQLTKAIEAVDGFNQAIVLVDSDVPVRQYTVQEHTAMDEINEMLDAGTDDGERLIAWVAQDNSVIVDIADSAHSGLGQTNLMLGEDGKLYYPDGGLYPPGKLVYGRHVDINSMLLLEGTGVRSRRGPAVYVAESTYDADSDMITIQSDGAVDPWKALTIRQG